MKKNCTSFSSLLALLVCALVATAACSNKEAKTAIMVEVLSDLEIPQQMDEVRIEISRTGPVPLAETFSLTGSSPFKLPLRLAVIPNGNDDEPFTVTAIGLSRGAQTVNQKARLTFLSGETRVLTLVLGRDCIGKECTDGGLTCSRSRCETIDRDPRTLPVYNPNLSPVFADAGVDAAGATDGAPDDVMSCGANVDEPCGSCGGKILCDGTCSVATPQNLQMACGLCNGTLSCDGTCSAPTPPNFGMACGGCGIVQCDGTCSASTPASYDQACGMCGGKVKCDGSCSVPTPANLDAGCGMCGGKVKCDGSCSVPTAPDYGTTCGGCQGTVTCDGTCSVPTPKNLDAACGCGGKILCGGSCSAAAECVNLALTATATAKSTYNTAYSPKNVKDGNRSTVIDAAQSWTHIEHDLPNWLELDFASSKTITRIELYTAAQYPIRSYDIQVWDGAKWVTNDSTTNNTSEHVTHLLATPVTTTKVRILAKLGPVTQSQYARINELEVYGF